MYEPLYLSYRYINILPKKKKLQIHHISLNYMSRLSVIGWCLVVVYVGEGTESTVASFTFVLEERKGQRI